MKFLSTYHNRIAFLVIINTALLASGVYIYYHRQYSKDLLSLSGAFSKIVQPIRRPLPDQNVAEILSGAYLSFNPTSNTYPVGTEVETSVSLHTTDTLVSDDDDLRIAGVDIVIKYDPKMIKITDVTPVSSSFSVLVLKEIDDEIGVVKLSLLAEPQSSVQISESEEQFASILWKPIETGEVAFSFDFTQGSTVDSNIAEFGTGNDLLIDIYDAKYYIVED